MVVLGVQSGGPQNRMKYSVHLSTLLYFHIHRAELEKGLLPPSQRQQPLS